MFSELSRRLDVDIALLDYNYERLFKCIDIMRNERIQLRLQSSTIIEETEQLPVHEYSIALEFYLQIDGKFFFYVV